MCHYENLSWQTFLATGNVQSVGFREDWLLKGVQDNTHTAASQGTMQMRLQRFPRPIIRYFFNKAFGVSPRRLLHAFELICSISMLQNVHFKLLHVVSERLIWDWVLYLWGPNRTSSSLAFVESNIKSNPVSCAYWGVSLILWEIRMDGSLQAL